MALGFASIIFDRSSLLIYDGTLINGGVNVRPTCSLSFEKTIPVLYQCIYQMKIYADDELFIQRS